MLVNTITPEATALASTRFRKAVALLVWLMPLFWMGQVGGAELISGPEWEWSAPDMAVIWWTTDVPTRGRVQFGLQPDQLTQRAEGAVTNRHKVTFRGLMLGTRYHFVVGTARQSLATNSLISVGSWTPEKARLSSHAKSPSAERPTTAPAPPVRGTWGNLASLRDHFDRHGGDFGARTPEDYARMAWEYLKRARAVGLPAKVDEDGVLRVFDPKTRSFAAYNRNGTTKTFFKPDSRDYFERQPGRPVDLRTEKVK
jgi:hypothetical protein